MLTNHHLEALNLQHHAQPGLLPESSQSLAAVAVVPDRYCGADLRLVLTAHAGS